MRATKEIEDVQRVNLERLYLKCNEDVSYDAQILKGLEN